MSNEKISTMLEIGCGTADHLYELKNHFKNNAYGFDRSIEMLKQAEVKNPGLNLTDSDILSKFPYNGGGLRLEEKIYTPLNNEQLHIWDNICTIIYKNAFIKLKYETEPPHGDFIYSLKITIDEKEEELPFWIYGRNIFFYGSYIVMEGMKSNEGYTAPLHTIIINIESKQYTEILNWYCDFSVRKRIIILENRHTKTSLALKNPERLEWYPIYS